MVHRQWNGQIPNMPHFRRLNPLHAWRMFKIIVLVILGLLAIKSSIYTIKTDSAGVIKRFGKYSRTATPGIHLKLPFGIETAMEVPVKRVQKEEFGFRTIKAGVDSQYLGSNAIEKGVVDRDDLIRLIRQSGESRGQISGDLRKRASEVLQSEYIMLTGDLNIVDVEWIVQYKIKDPKNYLFNVRDPQKTIRDSSQAVMRQLIGNGSVDEAITIGRIEYESQSKEMLQTLLDEYETGIHIVTVKLQSSNPPHKVRPAFNEVNKALQQKEQRINEAKKQYNEVIPRTKGQAKGMIESAYGYASERVNQAQGDVKKFERVLEEYTKAPDITRQRMYLETMSKVLPDIPEKWIIEQGGAEGGILMRLDLDSEK